MKILEVFKIFLAASVFILSIVILADMFDLVFAKSFTEPKANGQQIFNIIIGFVGLFFSSAYIALTLNDR